MNISTDVIKKNLGINLLGLNLFLLVFGLVMSDPFGWFQKTYKNSPPILGDIQKEQINSINMSYRGESVRFFKEVDQWYTLENSGKKILLSKKKIEEAIDSLINARKFTKLNLIGHETEYGFNDSIQLQVNTGENSMEVTIGGSNKNGDSYLRIQSEDSVYSIEDSLVTKWLRGQKSNFYFKKLVPETVTSKEILAIELIRRDLNDAVFQKEGESWMIGSKGKMASPEVENLVNRLVGFEANGVYVDDSEIASYTNGAIFEIRFSYKNEKGQASQGFVKCIGKSKNNEYIIKSSFADILYKAEEYQIEPFLNKKSQDFIGPQ
jgi:hypothetical protein